MKLVNDKLLHYSPSGKICANLFLNDSVLLPDLTEIMRG